MSVDTSTLVSLDDINWPLFKDEWNRLRSILKCLKKTGESTVAILTVVKGWNLDDMEGYVKLIALGYCSMTRKKEK